MSNEVEEKELSDMDTEVVSEQNVELIINDNHIDDMIENVGGIRYRTRHGVRRQLCSISYCSDVICADNDSALCRVHYNSEIRRYNRRRHSVPLLDIERIENSISGPIAQSIVIHGDSQEDDSPMDFLNIEDVRNPNEASSEVPTIDISRVESDPPNSNNNEEANEPHHINFLERRTLLRRRRLNSSYSSIFFDLEDGHNVFAPKLFKQEEIIFCKMCNEEVEESKVVLDCKCTYHLNCYLLIQEDPNCFKCGDKINKTEEDYPDCGICLEKLTSKKARLPCKHGFHMECINRWIKSGRGMNTDKCPLCREHLH